MHARKKQLEKLVVQRMPVLKSPSPPKYVDPVRSILKSFQDVTPLRNSSKKSASKSPEQQQEYIR